MYKVEFLKVEVQQLLDKMEKHPQRQAACAAFIMKTMSHSVFYKTCEMFTMEQVVGHLHPAVSQEFVDGV